MDALCTAQKENLFTLLCSQPEINPGITNCKQCIIYWFQYNGLTAANSDGHKSHYFVFNIHFFYYYLLLSEMKADMWHNICYLQYLRLSMSATHRAKMRAAWCHRCEYHSMMVYTKNT